MTPAARVAAAIEAVARWQAGGPGLDRVLADWGRRHRFAGSGDRRAIADLAYGAVRRLRSAGWVAGAADPPGARAALIGALRLDGADPGALFTGEDHAPAPLSEAERATRPLDAAPEAVRLDLPDWLMPHLRDLPRGALDRLRRRAGVFLRVNRLRTDRDGAVAALAADGIAAEPGPLSPGCLRVTAGARGIERSAAWRDGLVEIQDAASQAVADFCAARPGERVLDLCAGGGGKALALAAAMEGAGEVWAHDAAPARLAQIAPRAARAGAEIRTCAPGETGHLAGRCDLVLVDAPCSGSGAWARNPDAKWRLTPGGLAELTTLQDRLIDEGLAALAPGGRLVHATCSLIPAENGARVDAALARHPRLGEEARRHWTPLDGGDGFFAARLRA